MPAGTNTRVGIGIRRMIRSLPDPEMRNFEVNGQQLYKVAVGRAVPMSYTYGGLVFNQGDTIPYDAWGGTRYSNAEQLERDFNTGWVDPVD